MASPHVAGAAALYKANSPKALPADVKTALQNEGNDDWYVDTDPDRMPDTLLNVAEPNAVP